MSAASSIIAEPSPSPAMNALLDFLDARARAAAPVADLAAFERALREKTRAVECEATARELERFDIDVPELLVDGVSHHRVLRSETEYSSSAGLVRVLRTLYRAAGAQTAICPMELRAGIVEGFWTSHAAELAVWSVAHLTPRESAELFERMGGMAPSRAALDRLPKALSTKWEAERPHFERAVRSGEAVESAAVAIAISLDGVQMPMKDGERARKREAAAAQGKQTRGPAGYREAGCGTVSFYDKDGQQLSTVRVARMPEAGKATLKQMLAEEVAAVLAQRPDLRVVKLADGAKDNWRYLSERYPGGIDVVDFFHAAEHLHVALEAAYGVGRAKTAEEYERLRHALRWHKRGAGEVITAIKRLAERFPRRAVLARELGYFRSNRHRMKYAEVAAKGLPIGSGVVEASCKTLVSERMKRSGMRWLDAGGQAILTLRSLIQSDRFDAAWPLLASRYKADVTLPQNVVPFPGSTRGSASV